MPDKKKFNETTVGRVLGGVLRGAVRELPLVGGVIDNIQSPEGGTGRIKASELTGQIIAGGIVLISLLRGLEIIEQTAFDVIIGILTAML